MTGGSAENVDRNPALGAARGKMYDLGAPRDGWLPLSAGKTSRTMAPSRESRRVLKAKAPQTRTAEWDWDFY
jgi:hypothetical protein